MRGFIRLGTSVVLALVVLFGAGVPGAQAQLCNSGALTQRDMAGVWGGTEETVRIEVYPCGGTEIYWQDPYGGYHSAVYQTIDRLAGGGYIWTIVRVTFGFNTVDNTRTLGFKPAEAGYAQLISTNLQTGVLKVHRFLRIGNVV